MQTSLLSQVIIRKCRNFGIHAVRYCPIQAQVVSSGGMYKAVDIQFVNYIDVVH
jgi:hypothetical protein